MAGNAIVCRGVGSDLATASFNNFDGRQLLSDAMEIVGQTNALPRSLLQFKELLGISEADPWASEVFSLARAVCLHGSYS